jgi:hypothetical protein
MTAEDCRHGMNPEWCADCTGRDGGQRAQEDRDQRLVEHYGWIRAKHPGTCAACGEPFRPGTPIALDATGLADGWIASCCEQENT